MNNNLFYSRTGLNSLIMFAALLLTACHFSGCTKSPCKDVVCQNGGTCNNGSCTCPVGYEGALCQTKTITKLLGSYTVSGMGVTTGCSLAASSSFDDRVNITFPSPVWGFCPELQLYATVSGNNITIPLQVLPSTVTFSGSGTINSTSSNLVITLTLTIANSNIACANSGSNMTVTWTKL